MKIRLIFLLIIACFSDEAQERLGITNSNYYSVNSIYLNPSSSVDCRTYMQFNIIGVNAFAKTNFGYLPNFGITQAANLPDFVRSESKRKKFLYATGSAEGPGFILSKRTYGVGFFTRIRFVADMRRVSYELASSLLNGDGLNSNTNRDLMGQDFRNAKFSTMTWVEYGVNFGKMIKRSRDEIISLGGNLRYLTGISILYANMIKFDSYSNSDGSFGVNELRAKVLRNTPRWKAGRGVGLDIGITYKKMEDYVEKYYANSKLSNCRYVDYKYKIGISLRDAGFIRYKGADNIDTRVDGAGHFDPLRTDTSIFSAMEYNFNSTTTNGKAILACLPTALTGQFDLKLNDNVYLNLTGVKNLVPTRITGVQSPDLFSICPRVEFKQFEFALPLTFQKFIYPQLGFGIRYRSFVIGMDNMFPLFWKKNTYGLNVYVNLAYSLFTNPACSVKRSSVSDCPRYKRPKKDRPKRRKSFAPKRKANVF